MLNICLFFHYYPLLCLIPTILSLSDLLDIVNSLLLKIFHSQLKGCITLLLGKRERIIANNNYNLQKKATGSLFQIQKEN